MSVDVTPSPQDSEVDESDYVDLFAKEQRRRGNSEGTISSRTRTVERMKEALGCPFEDVTRRKIKT